MGEEGREKDELSQIVIIAGTTRTNNIIHNLTSANNQVNWREKTPPPRFSQGVCVIKQGPSPVNKV